MPEEHADDVLVRLRIHDPASPDADDVRALVEYVVGLGGTDEEVIAAARRGGLGPLALDLAMRTPGVSLSLDAFAHEAGIDPDLVRRVWRAFGLPESSTIPFPVTPDAGEAVRVMTALRASLGEDVALGFARVVGLSAARIADALSSTFRVGVEVPQRVMGMPYSEVARGVSTLARNLLPGLWRAIGAVFRRHLVLVSYQRWSTDEDQVAVTIERTVGFVDLVGSTQVLRSLSVADMADLVNRFEKLVWDEVTLAGGRVVKLIGDEAMFVLDEPTNACRLALRLVETSPQPVRVGLAHGAVVAFHGDYYGPTVNLAARLVAAAAPSTIVTSESIKTAAAQTFQFDLFPTGPLRGFADETAAFLMS